MLGTTCPRSGLTHSVLTPPTSIIHQGNAPNDLPTVQYDGGIFSVGVLFLRCYDLVCIKLRRNSQHTVEHKEGGEIWILVVLQIPKPTWTLCLFAAMASRPEASVTPSHFPSSTHAPLILFQNLLVHTGMVTDRSTTLEAWLRFWGLWWMTPVPKRASLPKVWLNE